jgi:hypothetical protein
MEDIDVHPVEWQFMKMFIKAIESFRSGEASWWTFRSACRQMFRTVVIEEETIEHARGATRIDGGARVRHARYVHD